MKKNELLELIKSLPDEAEIFVGAWSPEEDYDRTSNIKVCTLNGLKNTQIVICDKNSEYWNREISLSK